MSRLQVGGLALIINDQFNENVGKVVRINGFYGDLVFNGETFKNCFDIECDSKLLSECIQGGRLEYLNHGIIPQSWLMPLGDKQTQDEFIKELEEA